MVIVSSVVSHQSPAAALQLQRSEYLVKKIFGGVEVRPLPAARRCPELRRPLRPLPACSPTPLPTPSSCPRAQDKPETVKADTKAAQDAREAEGAVDGEHLRHSVDIPQDMRTG